MTDRLKAEAIGLGASFFGVADLSPVLDEVARQGGGLVERFPRALSVGIALPSAIVDHLEAQSDPMVMRNYSHHGYAVINTRLDTIASALAGTLQREGYRTLPVPAAQTLDEKRHLGLFSHKLAAHMAGLGWIGKSCLLVNPEAGTRVRWISILTEAPVEPTGGPAEQQCGDCTMCVDICPVHAFTGRAFDPAESRELRFDVARCKAHQRRMHDEVGVSLCGLCLYVCPRGRNRARTQDAERLNRAL